MWAGLSEIRRFHVLTFCLVPTASSIQHTYIQVNIIHSARFIQSAFTYLPNFLANSNTPHKRTHTLLQKSCTNFILQTHFSSFTAF